MQHKIHLVRPPNHNKSICGINVKHKFITLNPYESTCQSCLRCMNINEVRIFLGDESYGKL
jgi:hypothetical protein